MFGPWLLPLIGASFGALKDKKNPVRGGLLGGALGYGGGMVAPMLGGASAATNPALIESAVGTTGYGASSATPTGLFGTIGQYAKPLGQAASAAGSVQGLLGGQQQPQPMPAQLGATGDPIGQLLNSQQQEEMMRKQIMEKLQRRMYGGTL